MLIDTHAHLTDIKLMQNLDNILQNAINNDVRKIITIGCTIDHARLAIEMCLKYPETIYAAVGLYPHDSDSTENQHLDLDSRLNIIKNLVMDYQFKLDNRKTIVAVGECGLDYKEPAPREIKRNKRDQIKIFEYQLDLAKSSGLPIVIHSRDSTTDTVDIIKRYSPIGVWHCFTENTSVLRQILDKGMYISVGGIITYKNNPDLLDVIEFCPLDRLLLETDAPYLVPEPLRSRGLKPNEPAFIVKTLEKISQVKQIDPLKLGEILTKNACMLFGL